MAVVDSGVAVSVEGKEPGLLHARARGRLSWDSHAKLGEQLDLETGFDWRSQGILLDLVGVGFIDSSGISSLLTFHREVTQQGGQLVLCNVPPRINQTFRLVGLATMIPVASTIEDGWAMLRQVAT